jgi:hypothetical protein
MQTFRYSALNLKGDQTSGSITATSESDAIQKLRDLALYPTKIEASGKPGAADSGATSVNCIGSSILEGPVGAHQTCGKVMKRKSYPIGFRLVRMKLILLLLVCFVGMASVVFFMWIGTWLDKIMWMGDSIVSGILVLFILAPVILGIYASIVLRSKTYARMPCPECGRMNLEETISEDSQKWDLLVCKNCAVEWITGVSNETS